MNNHKINFSINPDHVAVLDCPKYHEYVLDIPNLSVLLSEILKHPNENRASTIIKTSARLSWIAEKTSQFAAGRDIFSFNYFAIIAESSAKICFVFKKKGESRKHCRRFFNELLPNKAKKLLVKDYIATFQGTISTQELADLIYNLRCDLAHEGNYFHFSLKDNENQVPLGEIYRNEIFTIRLTLNDLKKVVLLGALNAASFSMNSQGLKIRLKSFLE
ncbi:MAG: hypothetical protein LAT57_14405 [Balneolales bacterium]|nr:hypothetical protein [Balneolales bacterium]